MTAFLWVMVVLLALDSLGKISWLSKGVLPAREPFEILCDVVLNFALVGWALWLL